MHPPPAEPGPPASAQASLATEPHGMREPPDAPDVLYAPAVRHVIETQQVSIAGLQRRFRMGWNRAARLVERMENEGIVGSAPSLPPARQVLIRRPLPIDDLEQRVTSTTIGCLQCGAVRDPDLSGGQFCSAVCAGALARDLVEETAGRLLRVEEVDVLSGYGLALLFSDGTRGTADVRSLLAWPVFEALADPALFAKACVSRGAVSWPGDIDIATEALYALAHGLPHPETLEQARANEREVARRRTHKP